MDPAILIILLALLGFSLLGGAVVGLLLLYVYKHRNDVRNTDVYGNLVYRLPCTAQQARLTLMRTSPDDIVDFHYDEKAGTLSFEGGLRFHITLFELEEGCFLYARRLYTWSKGRGFRILKNRFFAQKLGAEPFDLDTFSRIRVCNELKKGD